MTLFAIARLLCKRLEQRATDHLLQQQLRRLDAHLLRDIGFERDGDRIVPRSGVVETPPPAPVELSVDAVETVTKPVASLPPGGEPQAGGG